MFLRFGKYDLFGERACRRSDLCRGLKTLAEKAAAKRGRHWIYARENMPRIEALATWVHEHRHQLQQHLPLTKAGRRWPHRHLIVKEFKYLVKAVGVGMFVSRGIEGSNLRLTMDVDSQGLWHCRFGEYLNLSGVPLAYREEFPKPPHCDLCGKGRSLSLCTICGRWACAKCSVNCDDCGRLFCSNCNTSYGRITHPAHLWYFHREQVCGEDE